MNTSWRALVLLALVFSSVSCASLKRRAGFLYLKKFRDRPAENVTFSAPAPPYKKQGHSVLDALWWNPRSASSISYFSSCSTVPKSLKEFQQHAIPAGLNYKTLRKNSSKRHLYSVLEVPQPPQNTYIAIHTAKKGSCWFNLNLVTSSYSSFQEEEKIFKTFIKGFNFQ